MSWDEPASTAQCPNPDHVPVVPATKHGLCADCHQACLEQGTCEICYPDPHVIVSDPGLRELDAMLDNVYGRNWEG